MTAPLFAINFRREIYQRERARARARMTMLGVWVAYFGIMAVILGLYGLNAAAYSRRTSMLERQAVRARDQRVAAVNWTPSAEDVLALTTRTQSLSMHRGVLVRLGQRLPINVRLSGLSWNGENLSGAGARKLVLTGALRPQGGQDRVAAVVGLVSTLNSDSTFSRAFKNVKLASTTVEEGSGVVEFVIECQ